MSLGRGSALAFLMCARWRTARYALCLAISACMQGLAWAADFIEISYSVAMQPLIDIAIGGQWLKLVYDASSGNTAVFVKEANACVPDNFTPCYSFNASRRRGSVAICEENQKMDCDTGQGSSYLCDVPLKVDNLTEVKARVDVLIIDGVQYNQKGVEAKDDVSLRLKSDEAESQTVSWPSMPVRLLVESMVTPTVPNTSLPLRLFEETDGILGASGPTLSCRNESVWGQLLRRQRAKRLIIDFNAPPQALQARRDGNKPSRIVFNDVDPSLHGRLIWSQPKQTGDVYNSGMHEFLIYHPKVCDVDLLYNTSSNWLAVIDTSGPCLTLPSFLFDRFRSRLPLKCPFGDGEASLGRLCSPDRGPDGRGRLPNLYFHLEDVQDPEPPQLVFPLERLVFNNGTDKVKGEELLCVARADGQAARTTADMMFAHIAMGSLAIAAFYTVVDLESGTVGLAPRGNSSEGSDGMCAESVKCVSPMQTYYPPRNVCLDPPCSEYLFMRLDEKSKMCVWSGAVPVSFGLLLFALVVLDFVSHRLYKQAIEKASEFST